MVVSSNLSSTKEAVTGNCVSLKDTNDGSGSNSGKTIPGSDLGEESAVKPLTAGKVQESKL